MNKTVRIILIIVVVLVGVIVAIRLFSNEDSWICEDGQWVRHGNPTAPSPSAGCQS